MYIYRILLYSYPRPIDINLLPSNNILNEWSDKYLEVVGFCKPDTQFPVLPLELKTLDLDKLKGYNVVLIQKNGMPKILKPKIKSIERVEL